MSTGTSSGRRQSAVILPVPDAEPVVGRYRMEYDPVAIAGVPAHITLMVPWLPIEEITAADVAELRRLLLSVPAFDYELTMVGWFGRRVLWLAPEPAEPFVKLTGMLGGTFGTSHYDDEFDEVVPHLTVGHASDGVELAGVAAALKPALPIRCRAREVWVMVGDGQVWKMRDRLALG